MIGKSRPTMERLMSLLYIHMRSVTAAELAHHLEVPFEQVNGSLKMLKDDGVVYEANMERLIEDWK